MWAKFKALPFVRVVVLVLIAISTAWLAAAASRKFEAGRRKDERVIDMKNSQISGELAAAEKLADSADQDKKDGVAIRKRMKENIEKMGQANENMDTVADRFNSKRLRKRKR
jgi:hypothetical protein